MSTAAGDRPPSSDAPIDWEAIERSDEFQELVSRKRRFVLPATIFFLAWYTGFILLAGYAEDFMGESITGGFTVGYLLALTQFVMVWVLTWLYLRKADREFDPLEHAAVEHLRPQADAERDARDAAARPEARR
jgi:uncharacterized membrane protein (DUF485 family)